MAGKGYSNDPHEDSTPFHGPNSNQGFYLEKIKSHGSSIKIFIGDTDRSTIQVGNNNVAYDKERSEKPRQKPITTLGPRSVCDGGAYGATVQIGDNNTVYASSDIKRHKPITTSTAEPTQDQMDYIADNIGDLWRRLGRKLGLSDTQLDNFKTQHKAEGQDIAEVYQMLRQWKRQSHSVTLQKLAEACDAVGRGDLSDYLS